MPEDTHASRGLLSKRWVIYAGRALTLLAIGFVCFEIYQNRTVFADWRPGTIEFLSLLIQVIIYGGALFFLALNWHFIISAVSPDAVPHRVTLRSYTASQIAKYLPGNVAHLLGRHLLLHHAGVAHRPLMLATLTEFGVLPIAAVLVAAGSLLLTPLHSDSPIAVNLNAGAPWVLVLGVLSWCLTVLVTLTARWARYRSVVTLTLPITCGFMLILGAIFAQILSMFASLPLASSIGVAVIGWLVGFLTPGSPGGVGTREATILLLMRGQIEEASLLLGLVLFRLVTVLGDVLCYALGEIAFRKPVQPPQS